MKAFEDKQRDDTMVEEQEKEVDKQFEILNLKREELLKVSG